MSCRLLVEARDLLRNTPFVNTIPRDTLALTAEKNLLNWTGSSFVDTNVVGMKNATTQGENVTRRKVREGRLRLNGWREGWVGCSAGWMKW